MSKELFIRQIAALPLWASILLVLLAPSSYAGCNAASAGLESDPLSKFLREQEISIRLDGQTFAPKACSKAALKKAWENHHERLSKNADLQFDFSVRCLDWELVSAFLDQIPQLPAEQLGPLKGKTIYLNGADMQLCTASPYQPQDFAKNLKLEIPANAVQPNLLTDLKVLCPLDTARALSNFNRAKAEIEGLSEKIQQADEVLNSLPENEKPTQLEQLGIQRRQRFNAAHICRINALALLETSPENGTYQAMMDQAKSYIESYAVATDYLSNQN